MTILKTRGEVRFAAYCNHCGEEVEFAYPLGKGMSAVGAGTAEPIEGSKPWHRVSGVYPAVCPRPECGQWSLLELEFTSTYGDAGAYAEVQFYPPGHEHRPAEATVLWPKPVRPTNLPGVPAGILADLEEGAMCMANGLDKAATILFRLVMEKSCVVKGIDPTKYWGLKKKLKQAKHRGLLSEEVYRLADAVKGVGDASAHGDCDMKTGADLVPLGEGDAEATCTAAVAVLNHLFLTPAVTERIRKKYPSK